ncbi:unnamed protein product [Albugo candida]|uniref:Anaphase-promoting complex subunit 4 WD40 domain-containing protein n=1 Tax=Albugo candida TaxID=65357 RepID=A0A024G6U8_9STRA|nr:unnamed protein product [Albugo candida]|eukprot:CCI42463.1 unnamed protein product [Albugo candida]
MIVSYPILGLSYCNGYLAVCGGGGSMSSGIHNKDIYQLADDDSEFRIETTTDFGNRLASGVSFSHNGSLMAISVDMECWMYEFDIQEKKMKLLIRFKTDFAADQPTQVCARFVGNATLLTGGEDGVVRVWKLSGQPSAIDIATGTSTSLAHDDSGKNDKQVEQPKLGDKVIQEAWMVTLTREYRGHKKRIRDIHVEQSHRNLVVSSSEDQSCHLWRLTELIPICKFSKDDALDIACDMLKLPRIIGSKSHQFRCARFSSDGRALYTILTQARGTAILVKWIPETLCQTHPEYWNWTIKAVAVASDRPVASMCVSPDDKFVSTAAVTGEIKVFLTDNLTTYARHCKDEHSFAVTGLEFAPSMGKNAKRCQLISGGADKRLLCHDISLNGGEINSFWRKLTNFSSSCVAGSLRLVLGLSLNASLMFFMLLLLHAEKSYLVNGPLQGLEDLLAIKLESTDAAITLAAFFFSVIVSWTLTAKSVVTSGFFWNGLSALMSSLLALYIATSSEISLQWKTGNEAFDELLGTFDYKLSIILATIAMFFLFLHSMATYLSEHKNQIYSDHDRNQ